MSLTYKCVRCNNMAPCVLTIDTTVLDAPDHCPYGFDFFNWINAAESAVPAVHADNSGYTGEKPSPQMPSFDVFKEWVSVDCHTRSDEEIYQWFARHFA